MPVAAGLRFPALPPKSACTRLHVHKTSPRARIMRSRSTAIEKVNNSAGTRKAPSRALSLEPNRYAVRCPFRIDHRQTDESSPIRHPRGVSPKLVLQHGRAVDEPGERRRAAERLEGKRRCARRVPASPRSIALPSGGKAILSVSVAAMPPPCGGNSSFDARWRKGGGKAAVLRAKIAPGGDGIVSASRPSLAKASNKIGAAAIRPTSPGTAPLSGRPTQTAMVVRRSKPAAQASR